MLELEVIEAPAVAALALDPMKARLSKPASGVVLIGTYRMGGGTNAGMALYCYGEDAERQAARSEPKWRDWLGEVFKQSRRGMLSK